MFDYYDGVRIIKDKGSKPIGVEWFFDDGTIKRFYVDDANKEWFIELIKDIKEESNLSRKERYHSSLSIDAMIYEGLLIADNEDPCLLFNQIEELRESINKENKVLAFISTLTDVERRRLNYKISGSKMSLRKIAEIEGLSAAAINKSFLAIRRKYLSFSSSI